MAVSFTSRVTGRTMSVISFLALIIFLPLLLLAAYQTATIISRAMGKKAQIVVDAGTSTHETVDPSFLRAFAQGGEETGNWLDPIQKEVASLKPKWVRIDHVYDFYDVVQKENGSLVFDFSRLDSILDSIRAIGATPFIALSYMPPAIARDGDITNAAYQWDEWALVVQKTIEHISGTSGKNIADVYYEVWNEPDHPTFGAWKLSGEKNYLTLYRYAAEGAARAKNTRPFYLGGPATTGLSKQWILALVESGLRLDFLSWHSYLSDPKRFLQDQRNIASWLIRYPEAVLLPKLVTEFGFTGERDERYRTSFAGAFTAAVFRQLATGGPQGLFSFELKGTWGIIHTPRFRVYEMLYRMEGTRLFSSGEGTWVSALATKQGDTVRIMLVNYDAMGNHTETVPVTVTNLKNGRYRYSQQYLEQKPVVGEEVVSDGTLEKTVLMPAHSVALIELYPVPPR